MIGFLSRRSGVHPAAEVVYFSELLLLLIIFSCPPSAVALKSSRGACALGQLCSKARSHPLEPTTRGNSASILQDMETGKVADLETRQDIKNDDVTSKKIRMSDVAMAQPDTSNDRKQKKDKARASISTGLSNRVFGTRGGVRLNEGEEVRDNVAAFRRRRRLIRSATGGEDGEGRGLDRPVEQESPLNPTHFRYHDDSDDNEEEEAEVMGNRNDEPVKKWLFADDYHRRGMRYSGGSGSGGEGGGESEERRTLNELLAVSSRDERARHAILSLLKLLQNRRRSPAAKPRSSPPLLLPSSTGRLSQRSGSGISDSREVSQRYPHVTKGGDRPMEEGEQRMPTTRMWNSLPPKKKGDWENIDMQVWGRR